jgi:hypothetical protein
MLDLALERDCIELRLHFQGGAHQQPLRDFVWQHVIDADDEAQRPLRR